MNPFSYFRTQIPYLIDTLIKQGALPAGLDSARVTVEPPREAAHGDLSTNAAMVLSKQAKMAPKALAALLVEALAADPLVIDAAIAGPGFINWRVKDGAWQDSLRLVLREGGAYGRSALGGGHPVNIEYVSANPTGPMHVGHARGAVFGDALAGLLAKAGYSVTREYYINDAGAQVDVLARSLHLRYREALGEQIGDIPAGLYPGDYLKGAGAELAARDGRRWVDVPEEAWLGPVKDFAIDAMLAMIRQDLASLGVRHEVFTSERALHRSGAVQEALQLLEDKGLIYVGVLEPPKGKMPEDWEPRPQTLFKATDFGDDVDRALKKSDGSWTYFAADIAYHLNKIRRSFRELIDVLGADHGGYVKRMQAAVRALSDGEAALDVKICQLVHLYDRGEPVKMSKRSGTFVTLRDVVDEVGKDIVRFMMLTRRNDQTIDFDFAKVVEQSRDNMVWYVQYAHARAQSVMRHVRTDLPRLDIQPDHLMNVDLSPLSDDAELSLIKLIAGWPRLIESAAEAHEPHRLAFYLNDIASAFHSLWNKGRDHTSLRFIAAEDDRATLARLALVQAVAFVIQSGLQVFGVEPVMEMR